jgi:hypothetical protein
MVGPSTDSISASSMNALARCIAKSDGNLAGIGNSRSRTWLLLVGYYFHHFALCYAAHIGCSAMHDRVSKTTRMYLLDEESSGQLDRSSIVHSNHFSGHSLPTDSFDFQ